MERFNELETQIRRRFRAAARGSVVFREVPTVRRDRDMIGFLLEWFGADGQDSGIAVHVDHVRGTLVTKPVMHGVTSGSFTWLDDLMRKVPLPPARLAQRDSNAAVFHDAVLCWPDH